MLSLILMVFAFVLAVIAMLADSVEAASRSIEEPSYERLHDMIEKIVNSKFADGQFDESPVTLKDLRKFDQSTDSILD